MKAFLLKMLKMLTSAYTQDDYERVQQDEKLQTNIGKLFSILAWGLGSVQDQVDLVRKWDDIDYAEGTVLDRYGLNYGVKRAGASDPIYRLMIKVKLLSQLSGGDADTVLNAASFLFDVPIESLDLIEFSMKIGIDINEELFSDTTAELAPVIAELLKRIIAAGIELLFIRTVDTKIVLSAIVDYFNAWPPFCGATLCGTYWKPSTLGWTVYQAVLTALQDSGYLISPELSGTLPVTAVTGYSVVCGMTYAGNVGIENSSPELAGTLPEV